ncbi:N-acetyl-glucosamine-6-phosphate deacetylase [Vanrija albida]|uniref:N-acetylglucosamine-6-phosphate deacetylase n=1 Tax=Vanrija albida TaxID=181172 RepID=A0ABR3PV23_9TREE
MSDIIRFTNGYLAQADGSALKADLYISRRTGKIISGQQSYYSTSLAPARTIDLQGGLLSPGLIDVQINGAYGVDFSELEDGAEGEDKYLAGLDKVAKRVVETGTTSFVPTIITQKEELYAKLLRLLRPRSTPASAHSLGYHAEGPFLHPERRGAHNNALLLTASARPPIESFNKVYGPGLDQPGVKMITAAPDVEGVMECVENLVERGVTFSIGHSDADLEVAQAAVDRGANMITHLFNAMPPIHHRDPGVIGLLGDPVRKAYYGIIVDGLHSHPNTVRIAYGAAPERCILVTDAQWIMDPNLPDGVHHWREGFSFRKEGLRVVIDGTNTLAGSAIPFDQCVANLSHWAAITLPQALVCATHHPAQMLGGEIGRTKGRLDEGMDADLVVFGWDGKVRSTWVMGEEVFRAPEVTQGDVIKPLKELNGKAEH